MSLQSFCSQSSVQTAEESTWESSLCEDQSWDGAVCGVYEGTDVERTSTTLCSTSCRIQCQCQGLSTCSTEESSLVAYSDA